MKKLILFLSVALIGAVVIGCGGGGSNTSGTTPLSGSLDKSFGDNGKVITSGTEAESILDIASNNDGTIFVAGATTGATATKKTDSFLAKYSEIGALVSSFGDNGIVRSNIDKYDQCYAIAKDGNIYVAGIYEDSSNKVRGYVARYNHSNGAFDTSFNTSGFLNFGIDTAIRTVAMQNGKLIVAIAYNHKTTVIRLGSNGIVDNSFGNNGSIILGNGTNANIVSDIAVDSNGKIILVGSVVVGNGNGVNTDVAMARLTVNGQLDATFGNNGIINYDNNHNNDVATAVKIASDGKILVTGISGNKMTLAKFNSNGTLDASFGANGLFFDSSGIASYGYDLTIDTDDNILVTGAISKVASAYTISVWRLDTTGKLDTTFNNTGIATYGNENNKNDDKGYAIALDNNGKILVGGESDQGAGKSSKVLLRINP